MFYPEDNSEELGNEQSEGTQGAEEKSQDEKSSKFDPSKLTPELQDVYKGMQADYTRKTQSLSEGKKSLVQREEVTEKMREQYEQKLYDLTQPKGEEKPLVDVENMTTEQRHAWDMLNKHFDKKIEEREKVYKSEIGQLKGYIGQMEWKQFSRENPGADKYRVRMREIQQEKGGLNCPLNLDDILTLAQKDDLKKLGAEEYKASVQTKKKAVTTKPGSPAGEEAEVQLHTGFLTKAQQQENWERAAKQGRAAVDKAQL